MALGAKARDTFVLVPIILPIYLGRKRNACNGQTDFFGEERLCNAA